MTECGGMFRDASLEALPLSRLIANLPAGSADGEEAERDAFFASRQRFAKDENAAGFGPACPDERSDHDVEMPFGLSVKCHVRPELSGNGGNELLNCPDLRSDQGNYCQRIV